MSKRKNRHRSPQSAIDSAGLALRRARGETILEVDAVTEGDNRAQAGLRAALVLDEVGKLVLAGRLDADMAAGARAYYAAWYRSLPGGAGNVDGVRVDSFGSRSVSDRMMSGYAAWQQARQALAPDQRSVVDNVVLFDLSISATRAQLRMGQARCLRLLRDGCEKLDRHFRT